MSDTTHRALHRVLKRKDTLALAFGAMIGWSWVLLTGEWTTTAGTIGAALAFAGGGIVVVLIALTYAELAAALPAVGGEHVYSLRALGRAPSFICSWAILLGYVAVAAFEAVALPFALSHLFAGFDSAPLWTVAGWTVTVPFLVVGIGAAVVLTVINVIGIKPAAVVQQVVTAVIVLVGLVFVFGVARNGDVALLDPHFGDSFHGIFAVLMMVPIMFVGFDVVPQTAEEIDLPAHSIGRLLVLSVVAAVVWYVVIIIGVGLVTRRDGPRGRKHDDGGGERCRVARGVGARLANRWWHRRDRDDLERILGR